jgi:hypothetical protein
MGGDSKKLNGKGLSFSHLNEAGKTLGYEHENLSTGPQFHPGGGVESTKVWTKRNKRARGMIDFGILQDNSERSKKGDEHLKPPDPNEILRRQEHGNSGIDDEMVVKTPLSRQ